MIEKRFEISDKLTAKVLKFSPWRKLSWPFNGPGNLPKRSPFIMIVESSLLYSKFWNERDKLLAKSKKLVKDELDEEKSDWW